MARAHVRAEQYSRPTLVLININMHISLDEFFLLGEKTDSSAQTGLPHLQGKENIGER